MSIKSISKLDPFYNEGVSDQDVKSLGGALRMFNNNGRSSDARNRDSSMAGPSDHPNFYKNPSEASDGRADSYYNSLFEISKPIDSGKDGMTSQEFYSYKITYKDLAKNIVLDVKNYLNIRNNLGEFNLCAMVFDDYVYRGHKYFLPGTDVESGSGVDIKQGPDMEYGLSVDGNVKITGNTDITGNTNIGGNTNIVGKTEVGETLKVGSNISGYGNFYLNEILTATNSRVTIVHELSLGNNLSVRGTTHFQDSLTGTNAYLTGELTCNSITANTGNIGSLTANTIECNGLTCSGGTAVLTALHALWSDLAEYYLADDRYEAGTLMQFGGSNEVTIAKDEVNAVVTSKPAYLMNSYLKDNRLGCPLALVGRIPVKVIGKINKFDRITLSEIPGIARTKEYKEQIVIGRALETNLNEDIKLVECVVQLNFR